MTKEEMISELYSCIGRIMNEHPEAKWQDMYDAVYAINEWYMFLNKERAEHNGD